MAPMGWDRSSRRLGTEPFDAVLGGLQSQQISAGGMQSCGVTLDYRAYCWPDGRTLSPVPVTGGLRFRQIDTGFRHTSGVTYPDYRAYCGTRGTRLRPAH